MDDALQITRRLVEEAATSTDRSEGIELSFHDVEKAYPRVCRGALWDLLVRWGCVLLCCGWYRCCMEELLIRSGFTVVSRRFLFSNVV